MNDKRETDKKKGVGRTLPGFSAYEFHGGTTEDLAVYRRASGSPLKFSWASGCCFVIRLRADDGDRYTFTHTRLVHALRNGADPRSFTLRGAGNCGNRDKGYVDAVIETAQAVRRLMEGSPRDLWLLAERCRDRAAVLVQAYMRCGAREAEECVAEAEERLEGRLRAGDFHHVSPMAYMLANEAKGILNKRRQTRKYREPR